MLIVIYRERRKVDTEVFLLLVNTARCLHPQIAISLAVRLAGQVLAFKALLNLLGQGL
jgi:hypothetical protein